ncbi:outer membrane protein assembly factor BamA [Candidatus Pelagibacter sp.]|nr:outer membrane protein assembly factor BamA [Candidatus Pelagibacter sp.]MDC0997196.1 outer membrane protein assembly factor BamA [Candidatus Pelagibacter sp.]
MKSIKIFILAILLNYFPLSFSNSEIINQIKIEGNKRITDEIILMFSGIDVGKDVTSSSINKVIKNLYETNFFNNVSVVLEDNLVLIIVDEAPLIDKIVFSGLKAKKIENKIRDNLKLKSRSSYNEFQLSQEVKTIESTLKSLGYYFSKVEPHLEFLDNNMINLEYKIDIGNKAKIRKISFLGNKIFKDKKLKNIIISEEYKFWKFVSGKKYLQEQLTEIDKRLLKNFYLNRGFYNIKINTSFAKLINDDEFEIIFNIDAGKKINFNEMKIIFPDNFTKSNYKDLEILFKKLKGEKYSINSVERILNEIDKITIQEEFKSSKAYIKENLDNDKLNINFIIEESTKFVVEKINIFGNNVTQENVIRNQLELDEGDPFSEILTKKTENNLKSLNFFKNVSTEILDGKNLNSKIINFKVSEKPTGEIMAGAGAGTEGGTFMFGVKENNYLGRGLSVDANATISAETFKGKFSILNPNYNNSDKSTFFNIEAIEIDQLKDFGYKTNRTGFELGTGFEYLEDFYLNLSTSTFVEKIETDSTASTRQKSQAGNYFDTFAKFNFNLDKRNQKFKTSDGYRSNYNVQIPIISDTNTLTNSYNYKIYSELFENQISSFSFLVKTATSITGDDVKLTERLSIPSNYLRGFARGKVGPKDGNDFIGGNFISSVNLQTSLPILFENSQNLDAVIFFDAANIWGVDYDSSIDDASKIRSSIGIGVDYLTVVGPLSFSLSQVISKDDNDVEESFRFNLGTTF